VRTDAEEPPQTAWRIAGTGDVAEAWRAHLTPIFSAAIEQALATFPLTWVGREIKGSILTPEGYADASGGFDEIWEDTATTGLSKGGEDYLELRYYPDQTWMCDAEDWPQGIGAHLWRKYRVLADDIMAILDAVGAAEASTQANGAGG